MEKYIKEFLKEQKEKRKTYKSMIDFCCDSLILNNYIIQETSKNGYYWEITNGNDIYYTNEEGDYITQEEAQELEEQGEEVNEHYEDIYQYFIIGDHDAQRLETYTNEIIFHNEDLDMYILGVTHCGTSWDYVPANWKEPQEEEENKED